LMVSVEELNSGPAPSVAEWASVTKTGAVLGAEPLPGAELPPPHAGLSPSRETRSSQRR